MGSREFWLRWVAIVAVVVAAAAGAWTLGARLATGDPVAVSPPGSFVALPAGAPARLRTIVPTTPPDPDTFGLGSDALVLTPDGRSMLSADGLGRLQMFGLSTAALSTFPVGEARVLEGNQTGLRHDVAASPDSRTAYLTDGFAQALRVADLATRAVVATVPMPAPPTAVAATPDGRHVEVADTTGAVTTVDTATHTVTGSVHVAPSAITALTITRDGRRLAAVTADPAALAVLDIGDARVAPARAVALPRPAPAYAAAGAVAVDPDGRRAYVATARLAGGPPLPGDGITVIDLSSGVVITTVPAARAAAVAVSPDGRRLYLARVPEVDTVAGPEPELVIETRDSTAGLRPIGALHDTISTYGVYPILPSPDGRRLYTAINGAVTVIDLR